MSVLFSDGFEPDSDDVIIALMGMTGAGKSSFISLCSDKKPTIGHDLQSCTQSVDTFSFLHHGRRVFLVDTPGFDDSSRSDTEVLRELAAWLTATYARNIHLAGIIYLHRINQPRMQGSAKRNILFFKKLCGDDALQNVILATTMWDVVDETVGSAREEQLVGAPEFWGYMVAHGSTVYRHDNTRSSAMRIIDHFVEAETTMALDLQKEMVDQHKSLDGTAAAATVEAQLAVERARYTRELASLQTELAEARRQNDRSTAEAVCEIRAQYEADLEKLAAAQARMIINMEQLYAERCERFEKEWNEKRAARRPALMDYIGPATVSLTAQAQKLLAATGRFKHQWRSHTAATASTEDIIDDASTSISTSSVDSHRDEPPSQSQSQSHVAALSDDWTRMASAPGDVSVTIWNMSTSQSILTLSDFGGQITSMAWSHDHTWLAVVLEGTAVKVWDSETGASVCSFAGHPGWTSSVAWWQDETEDMPVVFETKGKTTKLWDMVKGRCMKTLRGTHLADFPFWSHDWTHFALVSKSHTVKIVDWMTDKYVSVLKGHAGEIRTVAWSHDQTLLASASDDHTVKIWDVATGQCMSTIETQADSISLAWSQDGTKLASGTCAGTVDVWDVSTGQCVSTFHGDSEAAISSVVWSSDGTKIVSAWQDPTWIISDGTTGQSVHVYKPSYERVSMIQ